jgi:thiamine-phosphate pyrophosphorylase
MVLAELGADYVAIGPEAGMAPGLDQAELIAWWSEIFVVPCVAWDVETPEDAEMLARFGADFIAPSITIWQHANPVNAILALEEAIETGRSIA